MRSIPRLFSLMAVYSLVAFPIASYAYAQNLCDEPGFKCIKVKKGQTWTSLWPDPHDRGIIMRINRVNTGLSRGQTLAVPDNLSEADIMDFSPLPKNISTKEKVIVIDPKILAWGAYDSSGDMVRWGPVVGGQSFCKDVGESCFTSPGSFRIFSMGDENCFSTKFPIPDGGAPMPYCMYFNGGQALHGGVLPGRNASHGCVRLYVTDAEWMRYQFAEGPSKANNNRGTRVIVKSY